ncbi:MAG TPA: hypothetical protein HPP94_02655 [Desulfuromonadales bacterium]|nr:hypothetical protein [Desulfuromonadales bacterium]
MVVAMHDNARDLERDLKWFAEVLNTRLSSCIDNSLPLPSPLDLMEELEEGIRRELKKEGRNA